MRNLLSPRSKPRSDRKRPTLKGLAKFSRGLFHFNPLLRIRPRPETRARSTIRSCLQEGIVTQKVIEVVGTSKDSFAKAAQSAVKEAAKTVRKMKWAHVESLDMLLDGAKVAQYRATTKIYFDLED